ncbi:MAG: hypothetical protein GXY36_12460 [Chloroflexi bacterium]|jgi:hypothetical protein|nr:hypothetical protein [Chloroflexota bacterium]
MMVGERVQDTRIWWDGTEVRFVCWTEQGLIFSWCNVTETSVQIPRGAVIRLIKKGVLEVEGIVPEWIDPQELGIHGAQPSYYEPPRPAASGLGDAVPYGSNPYDTLPFKPAEPAPARHRDTSSRFSAVTRLIRKLAGNA